jgi:hypothetical protein
VLWPTRSIVDTEWRISGPDMAGNRKPDHVEAGAEVG